MTHIRARRDTAADWVTANPVLRLGELGIETDSPRIKAGDGVTAWNSLPYLYDGASIQAALASKADLNSPALTGNPTAPTPLTSDNDTSIATTAYVKNNLVSYAPLASPTFTGDPKAPTPAVADNDTSIATTKFVKDVLGASPALAGNPTAPTPATSDNDTSIATTAFVKAQAYAPLASPTFTGNPTGPTPATSDNDTSLATTAFVKAAITAQINDSGWLTPTLLNSWTNFDANRTVQYRRLDGFIILRGIAANGTINTPIFVLPAGFRPQSRTVDDNVWIVSANGSPGQLAVNGNGDVKLVSGSNGYVFLNPVVFPLL